MSWITHAIFAISAIALITVGATIGVLKGAQKKYFTMHKIVSSIGAGLAIIAIFVSGLYFGIVHAWIGLFAGLGCVIAVVGGIAYLKIKENKRKNRMGHIWGSRIWIMVLLVNLVIGLVTIFS